MSLQFNDTTTLKGLVQVYEEECGLQLGTVANDATKLKKFTAQANIAFDDFLEIAFQAAGTWNWDDSNHEDYPVITTNLIQGQRTYAFLTDENGNIILDVYKVFVKDSNGVKHEIRARDIQSQRDTTQFTDGQNLTGQATEYDKTANGIILNLIPTATIADGLEVWINREPSYFTYQDTTKKPGVPGNLHRWFAVKPAYVYARQKRLAVKKDLEQEVIELEALIRTTFGARARDERKRLVSGRDSNK